MRHHVIEFIVDWGRLFLKVFAGIGALAVYLLILLGIPAYVLGAELTAGEVVALVAWLAVWLAVGVAGFLTAVEWWA